MGTMNSTNINFISRADMKIALGKNIIDRDNTVVISVNDSNDESFEMFDLLDNYFNITEHRLMFPFMMLQFSDDESDFDMIDAKQVFNMIQYHGHKKNYLIHCFAGVSRSGAIAKFINDYFGVENEYLNNYSGHNRHVYNTLHAVAGTDWGCYIEELEKQDRGNPHD